jgi:hypothetical protein
MSAANSREGHVTPKPDHQKIHRPDGHGNTSGEGGGPPPDFPTSNHTTPGLNGPENANAEAVLAAVVGPGAKSGQPGVPDTPARPGAPPGGRGLPAARMLTANGQHDSHAAVLADGRTNRSPRAGTPYGGITWPELFALAAAPAAVPKGRGRFVILSDYLEADGRHHPVQRDRGTFHGLAVDVDTGNPSLDDMVAAVRGVIGNHRALVYSSAGATATNRKWRVLVPLATPVAGMDYPDTQSALFSLLEAAGVACDAALARTGQPVFLPNVPMAKRGPDGAPLWYVWRDLAGPVLELVDGHPVVAERTAMRARRAEAEAEAARRADARRLERLAHVQATGDTFEPVEHFNANHTVAELLHRYGFERGRGNHWRHPDTTTGSFATEDRGDHWVCLSAWAHHDNVGRTSRGGHRFGDAWDLYVAFEHGGDRTAAFRAYVEAVRPRGAATGTVPEIAPPVRVEEIHAPPTVPVVEIQHTVADQLAWVLEARPPLAVLTAGTAAGKTTAAVRLGAAQPGRIVWNVGSHAAAAAIVDMHRQAGHTDVAAMPPRDETTCACWTRRDVDRVAAVHGVRPFPPMEAALRVGSPMTACSRCPLRPGFKRPAGAPAPDPAFAAHAPADDAAMMAAFTDPAAIGQGGPVLHVLEDDTPAVCTYWERVAEAEAARILVQCQARTEKKPGALAPHAVGERVTVFTDEHGLPVLNPRRNFIPDDFDMVADVLRAAAGNERLAVGRRHHRSHDGWARAHEIPDWADNLADVAARLAAFARDAAAAGTRAVLELPDDLAVDMPHAPRQATQRLLLLLANERLPTRYNPEVLDLVRLVAGGGHHNARVAVTESAGGRWHASVHHSWRLELPPEAVHIVMDATLDRAALRAVFPDALVLDPPGAAPLVHDAEQWWFEFNKGTHPAVGVDWIERVVDAKGWVAASVLLPMRHHMALFPQTRPRGGRPPMDLPMDLEAVAGWNDPKHTVSPAVWERRMAEARKLAARVERLKQRMARDANGNVLVEHHRGTRSRGSNAFMGAAGVDGLVVLGQQRTTTMALAGHLLAMGEENAVVAGSGWGDVETTLPHVDGTTRRVRFRGHTCPVWGGAAVALNRAELVQGAARARANLAGGVPVVVVAAEPCGLRLADPPARLPAGVEAVVEAVRQLTGAADEGAAIAPADGGGGKIGGLRDAPAGGSGEGESRNASKEHTSVRTLIDGLRDSPPAVPGVPAGRISAALATSGATHRTVQLWLADAVAMRVLVREGAARATRYRLPTLADTVVGPPPAAPPLAAATGVVPATMVAVPADPGGPVVIADPSAEIVARAPHPREANTPGTVTGRTGGMPEPADDTAVVAAERFSNVPPHSAKSLPAPGARGGPAPTAAPFSLPANAPQLRGAARAEVVAQLRQHLRAASWRARLDKLAGHDRDDLAVGEVLALFADPPPPVARGP